MEDGDGWTIDGRGPSDVGVVTWTPPALDSSVTESLPPEAFLAGYPDDIRAIAGILRGVVQAGRPRRGRARPDRLAPDRL